MMGTVKPGLKGRVFTCTSLAVIFVDDQCPRLSPSFKSLRNAGDRILFGLGGIAVVIEGDIHVSTFVVGGLAPIRMGHTKLAKR